MHHPSPWMSHECLSMLFCFTSAPSSKWAMICMCCRIAMRTAKWCSCAPVMIIEEEQNRQFPSPVMCRTVWKLGRVIAVLLLPAAKRLVDNTQALNCDTSAVAIKNQLDGSNADTVVLITLLIKVSTVSTDTRPCRMPCNIWQNYIPAFCRSLIVSSL